MLERLNATTADGRAVTAELGRQVAEANAAELLWMARDTWQLFPETDELGTAGMDALLAAWCERMGTEAPGPDSACVVNWPSRDAHAVRALLDHGFVPLSCLAARTAPPSAAPDVTDVTGTVLRRAVPADFDAALALVATTFDYTGLVAAPKRANTAELLAPQLRRRLDGDGPVWVAERGGVLAGIAECGWTESTPGSWAAEVLPHGRWGYVNNVVTAPALRGGGIGQTLMSLVHRHFHGEGAVGTYLYYNPPSPLASVFWPRQGYRPLWTSWEVRPASALR
jgi:GNAT superfamily N-acetyltransferase